MTGSIPLVRFTTYTIKVNLGKETLIRYAVKRFAEVKDDKVHNYVVPGSHVGSLIKCYTLQGVL